MLFKIYRLAAVVENLPSSAIARLATSEWKIYKIYDESLAGKREHQTFVTFEFLPCAMSLILLHFFTANHVTGWI